MLNSRGVSEHMEKLYDEYKRLAEDVYQLVAPIGKEVSLLREVDLFEFVPSLNICYVKEGYLKLFRENREIRMYSNGDFIPLTGKWSSDYRLVSDFKSDLLKFSYAELLQRIAEDSDLREKWAALCEFEHRLSLGLVGEFAPETLDFEMVVKNFAKGEIIIDAQNGVGNVYEMISGSADIFVNDVQIGVIGNNELFGELPFLCADAVKTTVIARKNCFVRILEPSVFFHLIESNVQFATTLLKSLAFRIDRLNQRVVNLSGPPSDAQNK